MKEKDTGHLMTNTFQKPLQKEKKQQHYRKHPLGNFYCKLAKLYQEAEACRIGFNLPPRTATRSFELSPADSDISLAHKFPEMRMTV